jgi:hypothetical protein
VDVCKAGGLCEHLPTCAAGEQCCDGRCGECCQDEQCDDGIGCTVDRCFLGACIATADDGACATSLIEMYCSLMGDCRAREPCAGDVAGECDDGDVCTTDACTGGLCAHDSCEAGMLCCPDVGCGECCTSSQCDDEDPCTMDSCDAGSCTHSALCGSTDLCCLDPAGTAASCGQCCSSNDCDDDIACTVDSCLQGQCSSVPDDELCPQGEVCTPLGCAVPQACDGPDDCVSEDPCLRGSCDGNFCSYAGCDNDQLCCEAGCQECCGDADCNDNNACTNDVCEAGSCEHTNVMCERCNPELGCIECENESDCNDGNDCTIDECTANHVCQHTGGGCDTARCCGERCQECCSANDCISDFIAENGDEIVMIGEPCAACGSDGKCSPVVQCTLDQVCCEGQCINFGESCVSPQ